MAGTMTNDQIMSELEELFGGPEPDEEEVDTEEEEEIEESEEETEEEDSEEEAEDEEEEESDEDEEDEAEDDSQDESESQKKTPPVSKQSKQNHAFAEQRLRIKQQEQFIRGLGKLLGFDDKASVDEIQEKVKEVLLEKEAKDNGISVELARRLDIAESAIQENERIKLEKKVSDGFTNLIDKYELDEDEVQDFTAYLIDNGKNPMIDQTVDIEAEYLKLHYQDRIDAAVKEALAKEADRKKKVEEKAASGASKGATEKESGEINSVSDLDSLFNEMDL